MIEIKEEEYKEFFEWILERKIELSKEIDITLAHDYEEPYIYYTKEIEEFFETSPMKRIGKIIQLSTCILTNPNTYHTRLEHCKGAYKNALDFWLLRCKDEKYRESIEQKQGKIKILADIMEMARHDDCHTMLSHTLEKMLCNGKVNHEFIGKRILLENKEYEQALNNIKEGLYKQMCKNAVKQSNFQYLKEGNIDFDRMDYMIRDMLYLGDFEKRYIIENLNRKCNIKSINIEGELVQLPVYQKEALEDIKEFLEIRMQGYINEYNSPNRNVLDNVICSFCKEIVKDKTDLGKFIKQSIQNYAKENPNEIDLKQFLQADDVKFYSDVIQIAKEHEDENMREFASICIPNIKGLIQITIEMLDPKNRTTPYDENETKFINQVKWLKNEKSELLDRIEEDKTKKCITVVPKNEEEYEQIKRKITQDIGIDCEQIPGIITWNRTIKMYKTSEPIYVEHEDGNIYTLDNYPGLDMDLSDKQVYGVSAVPIQMKINGYSQEEIDKICSIIEGFQVEDNRKTNQLKRKNTMSMFKTENKPYIIGIEEK